MAVPVRIMENFEAWAKKQEHCRDGRIHPVGPGFPPVFVCVFPKNVARTAQYLIWILVLCIIFITFRLTLRFRPAHLEPWLW